MCFSIVFLDGSVDLMAPLAAVAAVSSPVVAAAVVAAAVVAAPVVVAPAVTAAGLLTWLEWSYYHTIHVEGGRVFFLHQGCPSFVYHEDHSFHPSLSVKSLVLHYSWLKVRVYLVYRR